MEESRDVKYCVTAWTDLQGFSSHLEVASYDIRTNIGQQAVNRLKILENAIGLIQSEQLVFPEAFPSGLHFRRLNDAIMMTIDLPDFLIPSVGSTRKTGTSGADIEQHFSEQEMVDLAAFSKAHENKVQQSISNLMKFIGLVARMHEFIEVKERKDFFPGAKTVIATGFRKQFYRNSGDEDYFSANFSLSNAYMAEKNLNGPNFYVDNNILHLLSTNRYALNVIRSASWISLEKAFSPFVNNEDPFVLPSEYVFPKFIEVDLFRVKFRFRRMNSNTLGYLQIISLLEPYLKDEIKASTHKVYLALFSNIKDGSEYSEENPPKRLALNLVSLALGEDLKYMVEQLSNSEGSNYLKQKEAEHTEALIKSVVGITE